MEPQESSSRVLPCLPHYVLGTMMSMFGVDAAAIRCTSPQLRDAVDPNIKRLSVRPMSAYAVAAAAPRFPAVEELRLVAWDFITEMGQLLAEAQLLQLLDAAGQHMPRLTTITFAPGAEDPLSSRFSPAALAIIAACAPRRLSHLTLGMCRSLDMHRMAAQLLAQRAFSGLTHLDITPFQRVNRSVLTRLAAALPGLHSLRLSEVDCDDGMFGDRDGIFCQFGADGKGRLVPVGDGIGRYASAASAAAATAGPEVPLLQPLSAMRHLTHLVLTLADDVFGIMLRKAGLQASGLACLTSLQHLDLTCPIDGSFAWAAVPALTALTYLRINSPDWSNETHLAALSVPFLQLLRHADLGCVPLRVGMLRRFAACPCLETLAFGALFYDVTDPEHLAADAVEAAAAQAAALAAPAAAVGAAARAAAAAAAEAAAALPASASAACRARHLRARRLLAALPPALTALTALTLCGPVYLKEDLSFAQLMPQLRQLELNLHMDPADEEMVAGQLPLWGRPNIDAHTGFPMYEMADIMADAAPALAGPYPGLYKHPTLASVHLKQWSPSDEYVEAGMLSCLRSLPALRELKVWGVEEGGETEGLLLDLGDGGVDVELL